MEMFQDIFSTIDTDRSGDVTFDELEAHIQDDELQAYFSHLNLEIDRAWDIFRLIDKDKSGTVSVEEFVMGCLRLRGEAKTLDVASISYRLERLQKKLSEFMIYCEEQFVDLQERAMGLSDPSVSFGDMQGAGRDLIKRVQSGRR